MKLKINGEYKEIQNTIKISELIEILSIKTPFALELNKTIIRQEQFDKINLKDGDEIEIVTFVGGG